MQTAIVFSILGCIAYASSQSMIMLIFARFVRPVLSYLLLRLMRSLLEKLSGIGGGGVLTAATYVMDNFEPHTSLSDLS